MFKNSFHTIDGVLISKEIFEVDFACDVTKCKGACCTLESEYGAPLNREEISFIYDALPEVIGYLPQEHREEIEKNGFFEVKNDDFLTRSIDNKACVFVYYSNGIAFCALERAFLDKKTFFRKPISCHLFPIRVTNFGGEILRYERFSDCQPALINGEAQNCKIIDFCKESLIRKYGEDWYNKVKKEIRD